MNWVDIIVIFYLLFIHLQNDLLMVLSVLGYCHYLGCFLVACLSRTNQQTSKLFLEGAVSSLKLHFLRDPREEEEETEEGLGYLRELAKFALSNLGITLERPPKKHEKEKEAERETGKERGIGEERSESEELLRAIGITASEVIEIFKRHQIDQASIKLLKDKDLVAMGIEAMGPRKKILYYARSLRRADKPNKTKKRKKEGTSVEQNHCLVCFDQGMYLFLFIGLLSLLPSFRFLLLPPSLSLSCSLLLVSHISSM